MKETIGLRIQLKSSEEEHRVDAKAPNTEERRGQLRTEERRGQLRKATGSRKQALIRGCLNGETRLGQCPVTSW